MKVTDAYRVSLVAAHGARLRKRGGVVDEADRVPASADQVVFSGHSVEVGRARLLALQAPELRAPLVDAIRVSIQSGQYQVSGADVAPKLIREHLSLARV